MRKHLLILLALPLLFWMSACETSNIPKPYNEGINITPTPLELTQKEGVFNLNNKTVFVADNEAAQKIASSFATKIKNSTGYSLDIQPSPFSSSIHLTLEDNLPVNEEGYLLNVTPEKINIRAKTPQGLFYGMQTVMQLLPAEIESPTLVKGIDWRIPAVEIRDEPRFGYRGMHLDVCRHFRDIDFIKKQLDVLSLFKINKLHWHLTEDQGWRIEIKKYPELTTIGATRIEGEGNTYGPYFFTQEQVKEVVAYAKERFIEVIPEIELPGHAVAAIAAYPELSCREEVIPVRNIWGIANDVFCAGTPKVFEFLEDVLTEVIPLFESDYFHIGGDECPKIRWKECPKCQAKIKELGLKADKEHTAEEKLQSYFAQHFEQFLLKHNKKMIGWDEIIEGGLAPSATVMSWRGEKIGISSANMGHDVIMTPNAVLYFDKHQGDSKILPVSMGGYLPLSKVYAYEPIPHEIDEDKKHHILGAQANLWAEYKYTDNDMEHDIYPRIIALAELNWTPKEKKNYEDFERRLENQRARLDMHHINYYIPMPENKGVPSCNFIAFTDSVTLEFKSTEPVKMVYTTNGNEPNEKSTVYTEPLTFTDNTTLKIRSIVLSGKMSPVRTITIDKQTYAPAVQKETAEEGLKAEYYKGNHLTVAALDGKTPDETEQIAAPQNAGHRVNGWREVYEDDFYSTVLTGYINIPEDGVYYFSTDHEMWLDGNLFISNVNDNPGTAHRFSRSDRSVALAKGYHTIKLIRLGAIFGGWPEQWETMRLQIRKADEPQFKSTNKDYFM